MVRPVASPSNRVQVRGHDPGDPAEPRVTSHFGSAVAVLAGEVTQRLHDGLPSTKTTLSAWCEVPPQRAPHRCTSMRGQDNGLYNYFFLTLTTTVLQMRS